MIKPRMVIKPPKGPFAHGTGRRAIKRSETSADAEPPNVSVNLAGFDGN
jgi:hypothetical protein